MHHPTLWLGHASFLPFWPDPFWSDAFFWPFLFESPFAPREAPDVDVPTGGLQLDVLPRRAVVFVDGVRMGHVSEFCGYYQHLILPAGPHNVELLLEGYQPRAIDVAIAPGRTTTFRGTLEWGQAR
jgi:hypothetical protein